MRIRGIAAVVLLALCLRLVMLWFILPTDSVYEEDGRAIKLVQGVEVERGSRAFTNPIFFDPDGTLLRAGAP